MAQGIGRKIELPDEGIHTPDGFLFHHVGTVCLNSEQIARLQEYGVGYKVGAHFTPQEDEVIRSNWAKFAAEYDLEADSVLTYCGKGDRKGDPQEARSEVRRRNFCVDTNFWPKMCHGLPHRSGNQVKMRMIRIFDPAVVAGHAQVQFGKRIPLTWSEVMELMQLSKIYDGDIHAVAEHMKKPYIVCYNAYKRHLEHNGRVFKEQWKTLWDTICKQTKAPITSLVRKAIIKQDRERLETATENIDFDKVAKAMIREEKYCKSAWWELLEELLKECEAERGNYEDMHQTWAAIYKKVFNIRESISPEQYSAFLRLLSKCLLDGNDCTSTLFMSKHVDLTRLSKKMKDKQITGFHTGETPISEVDYLVLKTRRMLSRCEMHVLSRLVIKYTLKERIRIAYGAVDRQLAGGTNWVTHQGVAFVSRWAYIEALIVFTKKLDDAWIPPTKFKKYVKNDDVLELFSEVKDNSALLSNGEHMKLLKEYEELPIDGEGEDGERMELEDES